MSSDKKDKKRDDESKPKPGAHDAETQDEGGTPQVDPPPPGQSHDPEDEGDGDE